MFNYQICFSYSDAFANECCWEKNYILYCLTKTVG